MSCKKSDWKDRLNNKYLQKSSTTQSEWRNSRGKVFRRLDTDHSKSGMSKILKALGRGWQISTTCRNHFKMTQKKTMKGSLTPKNLQPRYLKAGVNHLTLGHQTLIRQTRSHQNLSYHLFHQVRHYTPTLPQVYYRLSHQAAVASYRPRSAFRHTLRQIHRSRISRHQWYSPDCICCQPAVHRPLYLISFVVFDFQIWMIKNPWSMKM